MNLPILGQPPARRGLNPAGRRRIVCLLVLLILALAAGCAAGPTRGGSTGFALVEPKNGLTRTPFQPSAPTATAQDPDPALTLPDPSQTEPSNTWQGFDFNASSRQIVLEIQPPGEVNGGEVLRLAFYTGWPCEYVDHRVCTTLHSLGAGRPWLLLLTIHSGMGGEAEPLREALEGSGLNRALYPLDQIAANLTALNGAPVTLGWSDYPGTVSPRDLRVLAAARVPPDWLTGYFNLPLSETLDRLAELNPVLSAALNSGQPLLVIETCGWRHPQEANAPDVTDTTGSIYLVVIGK